MNANYKGRLKRVSALTMAAVLTVAVVAPSAATAAGSISAKSVTLGNSDRSASTTYNFKMTASTATAIKCITFTPTTTQGGATAPTGFTGASATLAANSGIGTGFTASNTASVLKVTSTTNATAPSAGATINFAAVTNPSVSSQGNGGPYFFKIATFSDSACATALDADDIAFTIADSTTANQNTTVAVNGSLGETLTFALTSGAPSVTLSPVLNAFSATPSTATTGFSVTTNAANGYNVSAIGTTLTAGSNTIPFVTDGAVTASVSGGSSEYGLTTSTCGTGGTATCTYNGSSDQGVATQQTLVARTTPVNGDASVETYKAAVSPTQPTGNYQSNITYIATGLF